MQQNTRYCIDSFDSAHGKLYKLLAKVCSAFMPSRYLRRAVTFAIQYRGEFSQIFTTWKYRKHADYQYNLSIIACLKNEAPYVCEWIEYYRLMGVEHFYLYNNNGTDNLAEVLAPYIEAGIVTLTDYPGIAVQRQIYNHAFKQHRLHSKWFAIVDLDEFILPKKYQTLTECLKDHEDYAGLYFQWYFYGDSGHVKKPQGLVIENFIHRAECGDRLGKSVIQSAKVYYAGIHSSLSTCQTTIMSLNDAQCNHYFTKSEEEYFTKKAPRGNATRYQPDRYDRDFFIRNNKNDVYDDSMLQYVDKIKAALAAKNRL